MEVALIDVPVLQGWVYTVAEIAVYMFKFVAGIGAGAGVLAGDGSMLMCVFFSKPILGVSWTIVGECMIITGGAYYLLPIIHYKSQQLALLTNGTYLEVVGNATLGWVETFMYQPLHQQPLQQHQRFLI
jgi:hypothetical protein